MVREERRGWPGEAAKRLGVLLASGLIVGESLFNVALAGLIVLTSKGEPLAVVGENFAPTALWLALFGAAVAIVGSYVSVGRAGIRLPSKTPVDL